MEEKTKVESKKKKIVKIVLNTLLWIFLVFAFCMMMLAFMAQANDTGVPAIGKKCILTVVSDSMEPTIKKGDLIIGTTLTPDEKKELKAGDIITFFADLDGDGVKDINTHRIVKDHYDGADYAFRTKGDNSSLYAANQEDDGYTVNLDDIICTWKEGDAQAHGLGTFIAFLQSRTGFLCIIVIPLAIFFIYEIVMFVLTLLKVKNKDKKVITAEDEAIIRQKAIEEYLRMQQANGSDGAQSADKPIDDKKE